MYAPHYHHDKEGTQNYGIAIEKPGGPIFSQVYSSLSIKIIKGADAAHPIRSSEAKLKAFCDTLRREIDYSDNESKRLALDALDIKVYATRFSINIQGIIPADLATTARTWA